MNQRMVKGGERSPHSTSFRLRYNHGLSQVKLNNLIIGRQEGWRLELDGQDIGDFTVSLISDMTNNATNIDSTTANEILRKEYFHVQKRSYLQPNQWIKPSQSKEPLEDPQEKYYTHVVAEVNRRGVGFAVVDRASFNDGVSYVNMFYRPTLRTGDLDFSKANVVKGNKHKEPLEKLIERLALEHVGGRNLLTVSDASEEELENLPQTFRALAPKFDVPAVTSRKGSEYSTTSDSGVYIVIRAPEREKNGEYQNGVELDRAFQIFNTYIREGYIDEYATVKDGKEHKLTRTAPAEKFYFEGISKLVESAVRVNGKVIVPYKGMDLNTFTPLNVAEKDILKQQYLELGIGAFKQYKRYIVPNS